MVEENILRLVKSIKDGQSTTVTLTDKSGNRKMFECIYKESMAPSFFILISGDTYPLNIDTARQCPVISRGPKGETVSFAAKIIDQTSDKLFELEATKSIRPEDLREYFRINIKTSVTVSFFPEPGDNESRRWEMEGETVDLSQSGVLAILPYKCRNDDPILIELALPEPQQDISCICHVVNKKTTRKGQWLTSFHFDKISAQDRDAITRNCFTQQRKLLRSNVRTD